MTDSEQTNECCEKNLPSTSNPQNEPVHADGYTKIPPNESRRSKTQRIAQKEEEDLRRWKEENRPGPIQLPPEKLGGAVSLAEVRQRQQMESRQSKMRKKQRQEEMDKKKRQAEEEQIEQMKAKQREKAKSHEYKEARREEENTDLLKKKEEQRRKADILEEKQKQQEEDRKRRTEADHRRVNLAFLDRLEASSSGRVPEPVTQTPESSSVWLDEDDDDDIDEPQDTALSNPSQIHADRSEADDGDHTWTLMKLQNRFPYYERDMLEEIVKQCDGNYQKAYELLDV
ncbi:epithelial-stromal interaction 1 [Labeo rohita]|uniref:Epithelial-stromal interaction 1 n=1 Tax=Labeo rohita TaxID=84645 RepID=A0A498ML83_LABRO|nr:epithelial-stromal interaction 1 [Labeo rohita]